MGTWSSSMAVCATCRFWGGRRDTTFGDIFEALEYKGKCMCPHGGYRGMQIEEGASCRDWESFTPNR